MSLNRVMLIGNVGRDPEIRYVSKDVAVATITLATTNNAYTTKEGISVPESSDWHTIVLWRNLAKAAETYVRKGDKIYVEGQIRYSSYTDKAGISRTRCEIWAEKLELFNFHNNPGENKP